MSKRSPGGSIRRGATAPTARTGASRMEEEPPAKNGRPDGEALTGQPGPSPPPSASAPAPGPPEDRPRPESGGGCGAEGRRPSDPGGPGGGRRAQGTSSPASGDPAGWEAGAAAGKPGGTPDPEREEPPAMGGCCSPSVPPEVLEQEEGVPRLSAENEDLKPQNREKEEGVPHLSAENEDLKPQNREKEEGVPHLSAENEDLKPQNREKDEQVSRLPQEVQELKRQVSHQQQEMKELKGQVSRLSTENQQLKQQSQEKNEETSRLLQELKGQVSHLQQEMQALRKSPEASGAQQTTTWFPRFGGATLPVKDFCVQTRISGKTGGCEEKILKDVSELLSRQAVSLKVEKFRGNSNHLLLLFCPIASRMGTDIENALEGLSGEQKVLLVVMHYIQKDNPGTPVDAKQQGTYPAVVLTVHTRFTLQDGFYPCEMNKAAVADVAAAIKDLAGDQ